MFFHVSFSTKGRVDALVDEIAELVRTSFLAIAERRAIEILEMEVAIDHVHLLLNLRADQKLSVVMHDLKGASARAIFGRYPDLKFDMQSNSFWQRRYGSRRLHESELETVRRYIKTQSDRPLRHD